MAAGILAGTPAFSLMDMSRRKEPQFLSGVWGRDGRGLGWVSALPRCRHADTGGAGSEVPFWLKAALLGWMQGIWVARSTAGRQLGVAEVLGSRAQLSSEQLCSFSGFPPLTWACQICWMII